MEVDVVVCIELVVVDSSVVGGVDIDFVEVVGIILGVISTFVAVPGTVVAGVVSRDVKKGITSDVQRVKNESVKFWLIAEPM